MHVTVRPNHHHHIRSAQVLASHTRYYVIIVEIIIMIIITVECVRVRFMVPNAVAGCYVTCPGNRSAMMGWAALVHKLIEDERVM